jgi:hypothetical protein
MAALFVGGRRSAPHERLVRGGLNEWAAARTRRSHRPLSRIAVRALVPPCRRLRDRRSLLPARWAGPGRSASWCRAKAVGASTPGSNEGRRIPGPKRHLTGARLLGVRAATRLLRLGR